MGRFVGIRGGTWGYGEVRGDEGMWGGTWGGTWGCGEVRGGCGDMGRYVGMFGDVEALFFSIFRSHVKAPLNRELEQE